MLAQVLTHPWWIVLGAAGVLVAVRLRNLLITAAIAVAAAVWFLDVPGLLGLLP